MIEHGGTGHGGPGGPGTTTLGTPTLPASRLHGDTPTAVSGNSAMGSKREVRNSQNPLEVNLRLTICALAAF